MSLGCSYEKAMESNPKELDPYVECFKLLGIREDLNNYYNGLYMTRAIQCALNGSKVKYFEQPILTEYYETLGMSEDELQIRELNKMLEAERKLLALGK